MGSSHPAELARQPADHGSTEAMTPAVEAPRARMVVESNAVDATVITNRPPHTPPGVQKPNYHDLAEELIGKSLDHFEITDYLGGGGMGAVFRAVDVRLRRPVAIKVLRRNVGGDQEAVRRFQNEAQSCARLDHDHVARVYYFGQAEGLHYIAFELIEGTNLRDLVFERGPLPIPQAVRYTLQVAEALAHASSRDVVHRDIKPSNLLITPEGRCKLVDMGLSRLHDVDQTNADLTASGVTLGTFDYISPEQALDPRIADVRSDIYSLGCTLYFMLTGRPPFPDGNPFQKLLRHKGDDPADPRQFNPATPEELVIILRRMIAKEPGDRYASAETLVADLQTLARQLGIAATTTLGPLSLPPRSAWQRIESHLPWALPLALLLAIVAVMELSPTSGTGPLPPVSPGAANLSQPGALDRTAPQAHVPPQGAPSTIPETPPEIIPPRAPGNAPEPNRIAPAGPAATIDPAPPAYASDGAEITLSAPGGGVSQGEPTAVVAGVGAGVTGASAIADRPETPIARTPVGPNGPVAPGNTARASNAPPEAAAGRLLVVGEDGYATFEDALAAARNRDVIELRYNGRPKIPHAPVVLSQTELTIQAGPQYAPVLLFVPDENAPGASAMFDLDDCELTLKNVAVELHFPCLKPVDDVDWSLFYCGGDTAVLAERSSLTIRNAEDPDSSHYHPHVAFFEIAPPPAGLAADLPAPAASPQRKKPRVTILESLLRGEADVVWSHNAAPLALDMRNTVVLSSKRMLVAGGGMNLPAEGATIDVSLHNVTARTRGGFALLTGQSPAGRYQLPVEIVSADSIYLIDSDASFVEQVGGDAVDRFRERFVFVDRGNFYEGSDTLWHITSLRELGELVSEYRSDFSAWREKWGLEAPYESYHNVVKWRSPLPDLPLHEQLPQHYALLPAGANPALGHGAALERLPIPPSEPSMIPEPRSKMQAAEEGGAGAPTNTPPNSLPSGGSLPGAAPN